MLLNIDKNAKTIKGQKQGYMTGILYLYPNKAICPNSSTECMTDCLVHAGRGRTHSVSNARKRKTKYFTEDTNAFMLELYGDILKLGLKAKKNNLIPVVRLNGTSDICWELIEFSLGGYYGFPSEFAPKYNIFQYFPQYQFYDYTKDFTKLISKKPDNYHLTFSFSGENDIQCSKALQLGYNVAKVFHDPTEILERFHKSIDGDLHDLRFLDPKGGHIVVLRAKGTKTVNSFIT